MMASSFRKSIRSKNMGSGVSMAEKSNVGSDMKLQEKINKSIEKNLREEEMIVKTSQKLLLLGPGESGKSTILKQMRIIHNEEFTAEEREIQKKSIQANVIQAMAAILNALKTLQIDYNRDLTSDMDLVFGAVKSLNNNKQTPPTNSELKEAIKRLWKAGDIQKCYARSNEYQLIDSAKYFFESIDRCFQSDYSPNQDDILRCRIKTTGVVEVRFKKKDINFRVMDVGGQRSERRKWIQCFNDVNSIIFITSLSEYNQNLEEDETKNRMQESIQLFSWVCNHQIFLKTPIILFLNKQDLFFEKIKTAPITPAFPEYKGSEDAVECIKFIKEKFLAQNADRKVRFIYTHQTCATDTKQIGFVIQSSLDTILEKNLSLSGLK